MGKFTPEKGNESVRVFEMAENSTSTELIPSDPFISSGLSGSLQSVEHPLTLASADMGTLTATSSVVKVSLSVSFISVSPNMSV